MIHLEVGRKAPLYKRHYSSPKLVLLDFRFMPNSTQKPWCVAQTPQKMKFSKEPPTAAQGCCGVNHKHPSESAERSYLEFGSSTTKILKLMRRSHSNFPPQAMPKYITFFGCFPLKTGQGQKFNFLGGVSKTFGTLLSGNQ